MEAMFDRGRSRIAAAVAVLAVGVAALMGCVGERRVSDRDIDVVSLDRVAELYERQQREPEKRHLLLLDARAASQYAAGHIAGARNMQIDAVDPALGRDPRIEAYDNLVVYAENPGSASSKALAKRLMRVRYKNVSMFAGGIEAWTAAGLPTETGP